MLLFIDIIKNDMLLIFPLLSKGLKIMSEGTFFVIGDIKKGNYGHRAQQSIIAQLANQSALTQPNILYIGAASDNNSNFENGFIGGIKRILPAASVLPLHFMLDQEYIEFDSSSTEVRLAFESSDIVYFEAGDIAPLKAVFEKFQLKGHCKKAYDRGALVGGMCGGGSFMADQVVHYDVQSGDFTRDIGASLWSKAAISCHMDRDDEYTERHQQLKNIASSGMMRAIGLGANQAVVFDNSGEYALCPNVSAEDTLPPFYVDKSGQNLSLPIRAI